jgi:hypothetical protein
MFMINLPYAQNVAPSFPDTFKAHAQSFASLTPVIGSWLTASNSPNLVDTHWYVRNDSADSVPNWIEFEGDPDSGVIPRWYESAGIVGIDADIMEAECSAVRRRGLTPVHAPAYRVGSAVVFGVMQHRTEFARTADGSQFQFAGRIGRSKAELGAGIVILEHMRFFQAPVGLKNNGQMKIPLLPGPDTVTLV